MKVILVDPSVTVVCCTKLSSHPKSFTGYLPIEVTESSFQPPPRDQDVTKMFEGVRPLTIKMEKKDDEEVTVFLYSDSTFKGDCVLGRLRDRFQDRAKISIVIRSNGSYEERYKDFASMEEMQIEIADDGCFASGSSTADRPSLAMKYASFNFKITVDIPDNYFDYCASENENSINRKMLETGSYSDVTIIAGNGAKIKAHKCIIFTCSPVLAAMFQNEMKESQTSRIEMIDISEQGIRAFLLFLYCGDLKMAKDDPEIAFELLKASHKYQVSTLEAKMMNFLMEVKNQDFPLELSFKTYMCVRNMESPSARDLKRKCIQIFDMKPDELKALQKFKDLFMETPLVGTEVALDFLTSAFSRKRK